MDEKLATLFFNRIHRWILFYLKLTKFCNGTEFKGKSLAEIEVRDDIVEGNEESEEPEPKINTMEENEGSSVKN